MNPQVQVIETFSRVAPLGVRFWDRVSGRIIDTGLTVTASPQAHATQQTLLFPNRSGVYVLHHAPGLREFEHGSGDAAFWRNAPSPRPFVIEVRDQPTQLQPFSFNEVRDQPTRFRPLSFNKVHDQAARFQPFSFTVDLPRQGLLTGVAEAGGSPFSSSSLGVPLYSTVIRPVPAGMAVVRAELWDVVGSKPAAWALLEVRIAGQESAYGLADEKGRVAVIFPYPEPLPGVLGSPLGSPPAGEPRSLFTQQWPLQLHAFYSPEAVTPILPQLERVYQQVPATLLSSASSLLPLTTVSLRFGQDLIVKSKEQSTLLLLPAGSPL